MARALIAAALLTALGASVAEALPFAALGVERPSARRVVDRPEIRSYQPYSGLQFGFRPDPPIQRGVEEKRPEVVMPKRLAPLIGYGTPTPFSAQWYAYCTDRFLSFEPRTGRYTTFSGAQPLCR